MKRRKALSYIRKMIDNPAIAYMLYYLEKDTDIRRNSVYIYHKYRRYIKSDCIILPVLDGKEAATAEDGTVHLLWFEGLQSKNPTTHILRNVYPSAVKSFVDTVIEDNKAEVRMMQFNCPNYHNPDIDDKVEAASKMLKTWMEGLQEVTDPETY